MSTYKFNLPSGVECEVAYLTGLHQRLLNQQLKGETHNDRLNNILVDIIKRVGNVRVITKEFVENMLTPDRRTCLVMARQYTHDFEELFKFKYSYTSVVDESQKEYELEIPLNADGMFPIKAMTKQYAEYSEIERTRTILLERSKKTVTFNLLDGLSEKIGASTKKDQISSHTPLEMRRVTYLHENGTPIKVNFDQLHVKDLETLRLAIKAEEGSIDTELQFKHPEWETGQVPAEKEYITIDLLGTTAFFFPSGAI